MDSLDPMATAVASRPAEPLHGTSGGLVFRSDVICPWSTVALIRLRRARELGLDDMPIIHLAHALELRLMAPIPRRIVDAEVVLCAAAEPTGLLRQVTVHHDAQRGVVGRTFVRSRRQRARAGPRSRPHQISSVPPVAGGTLQWSGCTA
jgi:hypothetical protein